MRSWKGGLGLALTAASLLVAAAPVRAATAVYPQGGGQFNGGAEGWQVTGASCDVAVFCTASGGYDGSDGSPPGSLSADTNVSLNLLSLFHSTVTLQSPDFKPADGGAATLHLDRRFDSGSLVDLAPQLSYSAELVDRSSGEQSASISEAVPGASGWSGENGAATVKAGHTYALLITARTSSTVVGTGVLSGTTSARFDNVALTVGSGGENGGGGPPSGGGGAGAGGGLAARLAALRGSRLLVKARCPKRVGRACRLTLTGLLNRRRSATKRGTVKVAKGKTKRIVLRVKPRARKKVAGRKRLLFKVRLRAGGAQATAYKRLRLIRR